MDEGNYTCIILLNKIKFDIILTAITIITLLLTINIMKINALIIKRNYY